MSARHSSVYKLLLMCSEKYGIPDIARVKFTVGDRGGNPHKPPVYMSCHNKVSCPQFKDFCGPGHTFYKWNLLPHTFEITTKQIAEAGLSKPIIDKIGWYGRIYCTKTAVEGHTRQKLYEIASQNLNKFDVVNTSRNSYKSMEQLAKEYRYLIDVGGNGYSGRLKYLMYSGRPLIVAERNHLEYYHYELKPFVHYIPVRSDLADLLEKESWMRDNQLKCDEIAKNAMDFAMANFTTEKILERVFFVYNKLKDLNS